MRSGLLFGDSGAYERDRTLMRSLGLKLSGYGRERTELGTVTIFPAEPNGPYGPRPATKVKVAVVAMPAQFWHFTVSRPRDEIEEDLPQPDAYTKSNWRAVYEPVEVFEISTGSGAFSEYWPMVKAVANHCFEVERVQ